MNYNNNPYDAVGVSILGELFKQAEEIAPIEDQPTPEKPSLFKRVIQGLRDQSQTVEANGMRPHSEDCASPKPI